MVRLLIAGNGGLKQRNIIRTIYDPACGTGGMLTTAKDEISFTKYFYKYEPLRPLEDITEDIKTLEVETRRLMGEILEY